MEQRKKINLTAIMNNNKSDSEEKKVKNVPQNNKDGPHSALKEENNPIKNNSITSFNTKKENSYNNSGESGEKIKVEDSENNITKNNINSDTNLSGEKNINENNNFGINKEKQEEINEKDNNKNQEKQTVKINKNDIRKKEIEENKKETKDDKTKIEEDKSKKGKKEDKKEIFTNYKTDYKEEKISIIQKIKKLKNVPKTRYKFIFGLITITSLLRGGLFYLDPNDHSIQNYKASLFNIVYKDEIEEKRKEIEEEYNKLQEQLKRKIEYKKVSGFNFSVEYRVLDGIKTYKYNNIEYSNEIELKKVLEEEINNITKEKIKDALINSFK